MASLKIHTLLPNQLPTLQQIAIQTFIETFAAVNTEHDMQLYLDQQLSLLQLKLELETEHTAFYLLELNFEIIGYLKLNRFKNSNHLFSSNEMEIERIYILQSFQGQSWGNAVMQWIQQQALTEGFEYLWLGVWEHNQQAIRFYRKQGFEQFGSHQFVLGNDIQTDFLMRKALKTHNN